MNAQLVQEILAFLNLNFDLATIEATASFLDQISIDSSFKTDPTYICAAAAIVSEVRQLPSVSNNGAVGSGISIESVMRHLGKLSKETYLEVMQKLVTKMSLLSNRLVFKISQVKLSYRIFKKYRSAFQSLFSLTDLLQQDLGDLIAIFWIIFLFAKSQMCEPQNTHEAMNILVALLQCIFQSFIANLSDQQVHKIINQFFTSPQQIPSQKLFDLQGRFLQKMSEIFAIRNLNQSFDFKNQLKKFGFLSRYLDDLSTRFERNKARKNHYQVDEISFLELQKTLTPQAIQRTMTIQECEPICKPINFLSEDNQDFETFVTEKKTPVLDSEETSILKRSTPTKYSPFKPFKIGEVTPVSCRIQNLSWVKKCLNKVGHQQRQEVRRLYEKFQTKSYSEYEACVGQKIDEIVDRVSKTCFNKIKRRNDILGLFTHFVNCISQDYKSEEEKRLIFGEADSFNAILCLSADLFNYSYAAMNAEYSEYCAVFELSILSAFKPINWFGRNGELPRDLINFLYHREKRIVIHDIWENSVGFRLLSPEDNKVSYTGLAILKRLKLHICDRVIEVCLQVGVEESLIRKIQNLVKYFMERKPHLLQKNNIDQIILCCVTSCLNLNSKQRKARLADILQFYNKLQLTFSPEEGLENDGKGNSLSLFEYYNNIFLPELEESMKELPVNGLDILMTPLRNERIRKINLGLDLTPISSINDLSARVSLNDRTIGIKPASQAECEQIRNRLIHRIQKESILDDSEEGDLNTPKFGRPPSIFKANSFGKN